MNSIDILNKLKEFLEESISSKLLLKKPPEDGDISEEYTLVNPAVYECYVPLKGMNDYKGTVPAILVMMDSGTDSDDEAGVDIRIKIATYGEGTTLENGDIDINVNGYKDLLNVIARIKNELTDNAIIKDTIVINKPIKWTMDKEQSLYPYWFADISFNVSLPVSEKNIDKYL